MLHIHPDACALQRADIGVSVWRERDWAIVVSCGSGSMSSGVRVGEPWVIHSNSCAHITAVCSCTGPMTRVHVNNTNITADGRVLPALIENKQHFLMASWEPNHKHVLADAHTHTPTRAQSVLTMMMNLRSESVKRACQALYHIEQVRMRKAQPASLPLD